MRTVVHHLLIWSISLVFQAVASPIEVERSSLDKRQIWGWRSPPTLDSWFIPPWGWESQPPGTVLRLRPYAFPTITIKNCINTFQVQYRSSDTHGNPSWAVATVFIPSSHAYCSAANPDGCAHALVSYQFPYDNVNLNSIPSYFLQFGDPFGELGDILAQGYFVVVPDYEGPQVSYCSGPQAAYATLDAARAVLKVAGLWGLRMEVVKYAIWGYSGGAIGSAFAAELAKSYAPDLQIDGILIGGPTPNLTTAATLMNEKNTVGLVFACIIGVTAQYPDARQFLYDRLKKDGPYNITGFFNATTMSEPDMLQNFIYQDIYDYFINGSSDFHSSTITDVLNKEGLLGYHGVPNMPVFMYKAMQDEMSPVEQSDALYKKYCDEGANILYYRNSLCNHTEEAFASRGHVIQFLHTVLDGDTSMDFPATGCREANVTIPFPGWDVQIAPH